jgi:cytochrome c oxidase cbb3-type subunit 3
LQPDDEPKGGEEVRPAARRGILAGLAVLVVVAGAVLWFVEGRTKPPPRSIASDPLLVEGHELYRARCLSCHGETGRGDGPIAKGLAGPPVGDLTDGRFKHGDQPDQVRRIIEKGVKDTAMPGWKGMVSDRQIEAVTAYVLHLAGRPVASGAAP